MVTLWEEGEARPSRGASPDALKRDDHGRWAPPTDLSAVVTPPRPGRWPEAYAALYPRRLEAPSRSDLELLARSPFLLGRDDEHAGVARARVSRACTGAAVPAARCAFWIGLNRRCCAASPRIAGGWFGRPGAWSTRIRRDCVERGYLLLPVVIEPATAGSTRRPTAAAAEAVAIAERFGDADLLALALHEQGYALVVLGRAGRRARAARRGDGRRCAGELSPFVTGLVVLQRIDRCHDNFELRRAQEWTAALTRWCDAQPELRRVHRAAASSTAPSCMQLHGAWDAALREARRAGAGRRPPRGRRGRPAAYREAERAACAARSPRPSARTGRRASRGAEPQPGLRAAAARAGPAQAAARRDPAGAGGDRRAAVPRAAAARRGGDRARRRRPRRRRSACDELARSPPASAGAADALVADARGAVPSPRRRGGALADLRDAGRAGASSDALRGGPRARAARPGVPRGRATRTPPRWSSSAARAPSRRSAPCPTAARVDARSSARRTD